MGVSALLVLFLLALIASLLLELFTESLTNPPQLDEIAVAVKLLLLTSALSSVIAMAVAIRLLKETFDGIDQEYEDVARMLGYDKLRTFLDVALWEPAIVVWRA